MDIMELGAIGELVGGVAVIVTLVYLATQIQQLRKQNLLASYQYNYDTVNQFCDLVSNSGELTSIVLRGRESASSLTPEERFRFMHLQGRLLNIIESWHFQVVQTATTDQYRREQVANLGVFVRSYFDHPGVLEIWEEIKVLFNEETARLIEENTGTP